MGDDGADEMLWFLDQHHPDISIVLDETGTILHASASARRVAGWSVGALIGRSGLDLVHPDDLDYALGALLEAAEYPGEHGAVELRILRGDGSYLPAEVQTYNDPDDPSGRIALSIRDITLRSALPERRRTLERYALQIGAACAGASIDGLDAVMNDAMSRLGTLVESHAVRLVAASPDHEHLATWQWWATSGEHILERVPDVAALEHLVAQVEHPGRLRVWLGPPPHAVVEEPVRGDDGEPVGLLSVGWAVPDARRYWDEGNHSLLEAISVILTMTARRVQRERALAHDALHDSLTGLGNRMRLLGALDHELSRSRDGEGMALLFCDLDRFKPVNDTWGHAIGDELLRVVADRLRGAVREGDLVCRAGGDEFVVLCPSVSCGELAEEIGNRVLSAVAEPVDLSNRVTLEVSVSVGLVWISGRPSTDLSADDVIRRADQVMYEAKAQPGRGIRRYDLCFDQAGAPDLSDRLRAVG